MGNILNAGLVGLCLVLVYIFHNRSKQSALARQHGCSLPPKFPQKDPLFGLDFAYSTHTDIPVTVKYHKRYSKTFQINSVGGRTIWTLAPDNIRTINSTAKNWGVEPLRLPAMQTLCGRGFLTTDGSTWQRSRRLLKPTFNKANVIDFPTLSNAVDELLSRLPDKGLVADLQPLLDTLFMHTSTRFLTGLSTLSVDGTLEGPFDIKTFMKAFHDGLFGTGIRIILGRLMFLAPKAKWLASCGKAHRFLDFHIDRALARKRTSTLEEHTQISSTNAKSRSMLESLAEQTSNKVEIRSQIIQGMMASLETTSVLVSNSLFLLSRHTPIWEQLQEEVSSTGQELLTYESLSASRLLHNILFESLRLYPVFPLLARVSLSDTTLPTGGGSKGDSPIYIPKGTIVGTSYYALHREPTVFGANVDEFDPSRWNSVRPGAWEYMPFGGGERSCMGQQKALIEASYVLVKIAQTYKHIESRDDKAWKGEMRLTCRNANGCHISLFPKGNGEKK